jgi:GTPase SAR1 family protein
VEGVSPTVGFAQYEVQHNSRKVKLYDLGGSENFRDSWRHYYDDCYGFIYIIECSEENRFNENREVFQQLLEKENIQNKPILMYLFYSSEKLSKIFSFLA